MAGYVARILTLAILCPFATPIPMHALDWNVHPHSSLFRHLPIAGSRLAALNCSEEFFEQTISHFSWSPLPGERTSYRQRYFICLGSVKGPAPPVFFYFGNEDNVELYVEHTGLMWESAPAMGAALVFLEHRYYGLSLPFPAGTPGCMNYLTTEQAMADAASFLTSMRGGMLPQLPEVGAVIGFGGSYGGMMAAWFRLQYRHLVDGVICASAPILSFLNMTPPYDAGAYMRIVTDAASAKGGATDNCKINFRRVQPLIAKLAKSAKGRKMLSRAFRTCSELEDQADAAGLLGWVQDPWSYLAMGNFPYASSYLVHGAALLPAYPVRAACAALDALTPDAPHTSLLAATMNAVAVFYNVSKNVKCFYNQPPRAHISRTEMRPPSHISPAHSPLQRLRPRRMSGADACVGDWGYHWCTEMVQPFSNDAHRDMFWPPHSFNISEVSEECYGQWQVRPRAAWPLLQFGGKERLSSGSNIVFSNGMLDPWSAGGVLENISETVVSVVIPSGAHHSDLMFENAEDAADVKAARALEREHIARWIREHESAAQPHKDAA